ncbi:MAG: hypothetical protein E7015_02885 [Alphaproteobacteria bacterium]|nr:hypothetical protein [Alphaproteobacteria bacterium]
MKKTCYFLSVLNFLLIYQDVNAARYRSRELMRRSNSNDDIEMNSRDDSAIVRRQDNNRPNFKDYGRPTTGNRTREMELNPRDTQILNNITIEIPIMTILEDNIKSVITSPIIEVLDTIKKMRIESSVDIEQIEKLYDELSHLYDIICDIQIVFGFDVTIELPENGAFTAVADAIESVDMERLNEAVSLMKSRRLSQRIVNLGMEYAAAIQRLQEIIKGVNPKLQYDLNFFDFTFGEVDYASQRILELEQNKEASQQNNVSLTEEELKKQQKKAKKLKKKKGKTKLVEQEARQDVIQQKEENISEKRLDDQQFDQQKVYRGEIRHEKEDIPGEWLDDQQFDRQGVYRGEIRHEEEDISEEWLDDQRFDQQEPDQDVIQQEREDIPEEWLDDQQSLIKGRNIHQEEISLKVKKKKSKKHKEEGSFDESDKKLEKPDSSDYKTEEHDDKKKKKSKKHKEEGSFDESDKKLENSDSSDYKTEEHDDKKKKKSKKHKEEGSSDESDEELGNPDSFAIKTENNASDEEIKSEGKKKEEEKDFEPDLVDNVANLSELSNQNEENLKDVFSETIEQSSNVKNSLSIDEIVPDTDQSVAKKFDSWNDVANLSEAVVYGKQIIDGLQTTKISPKQQNRIERFKKSLNSLDHNFDDSSAIKEFFSAMDALSASGLKSDNKSISKIPNELKMKLRQN